MTAEDFLLELKRLINLTPVYPIHQVNCENCDLTDHVYYSKNLTICFDCLKCTDSIYIYDCVNTVSSVDCDYSTESELCYDSVDAFKCFNSNFIEDSAYLTDCSYCTWCTNSHDMFGCVSMHNKSFCIFNRQLTEEQYKSEIKKYKNWPREKVLAEVNKIRQNLPVTQTHEKNNENSFYGDYIYYSRNCYMCFDIGFSKNCGYIYDSNNLVDCYDVTYSTKNELSYQIVDSDTCYNSNYIVYSNSCTDSNYVINGYDVKNCLGSVNRAHAQYEILNRQFSKEEYERISKEILEDLAGKNLGWGDLKFY